MSNSDTDTGRSGIPASAVFAIFVLVGVALAVGINFAISDTNWERTPAEIIGQPELVTDGYRTQALVRTVDFLPVEIVQAVDDQAQIGDTTTVWINTDTGRPWRATDPDKGPVTSPRFAALIGALLGGGAFLGTVLTLSLGSQRHSQSTTRHRRDWPVTH